MNFLEHTSLFLQIKNASSHHTSISSADLNQAVKRKDIIQQIITVLRSMVPVHGFASRHLKGTLVSIAKIFLCYRKAPID